MDVEVRPDHPASEAWARAFVRAARTWVPRLAIDPTAPTSEDYGGSDHQPFADRDFPALDAWENNGPEYLRANPWNHTAQDASDRTAGRHFDYAFATDVVRAATVHLAEQAGLAP
jgi:Zn-dependent M28 family amino/carboxypeptidase